MNRTAAAFWLFAGAGLAGAPPPAGFPAVQSAFRAEQAKRKEYTGTIRAKLTVFSPTGGSETFPEMIRQITGIEGGVCRQRAVWADGKTVYDKEEVAKRCADLTSEFSGIEMDQLLGLSGYRAEPARGGKRIYVRAGVPDGPCLESSDTRIEVAPGGDHPALVKVSGGRGCAAGARGLFRDGSSIEARYALAGGVWQLTRMVEIHRAPFESHDVMAEVEFFFRTFKARRRLREPMIRIEKEFGGYRHVDRMRKLVANPVEGSLKEDSEVSIHFDLDNEAQPEAVEAGEKKSGKPPKPAPK